MIRHLTLAATLGLASSAFAGDWIHAPSYYSHDPESGGRVQQYTPVNPVFSQSRGDYRRSGYRQTRSSIQAGGSADHLHVVEEWGGPVRPYGEWRFPYRPYSAPYDAWAPQIGFLPPYFGFPRGRFGPGFGGPVGPGFPGGPGTGPGFPGGPGTGPGVPGGPTVPGPVRPPAALPYPGYFPQPWHDGRYAPYDSDGPYGYPDLLRRPPARPLVEGDPGNR